MAKVTGIGGVFFKTPDKTKTAAWFSDVLGVKTQEWGTMFPWREAENPEREGYTVMGLHAKTSDYFGASPHDFMLNFRVDDLDAMLAMLKDRGVKVTKEFPADENGKFAHIMGPNDITIELWEPPKA